MIQRVKELGPFLDRLAGSYGVEFLDTDPLGEVRRFSGADDREVAGFLAAGLAFGRVDLILSHLRDLWRRLEDAPARAAGAFGPAQARRLDGFVHRWVRGEDVAVLLRVLGGLRARHGSLRALFLEGYDPRAADVGAALARFVGELRDEAVRVRGGGAEDPLPRGVATFLADPARGGACKRLNLFLRWMVRRDDGLDLGLWPEVDPAKLVVPLDTHVSRISRYLGLTGRRTADWRMAAEVTAGLRAFDPDDPVRYDFALSRMGILDHCPRRTDPVKCRGCTLRPVCVAGGDHHG